MSVGRLIVAAVLFVLSPVAMSAPCAGFTDVEDSDPFCADVAWIANRSITLGCGGTFYCPHAPVSRLAMAAFLHRLGVLIPDTYPRIIGTQVNETTPLAPGASDTWSTFGWPVNEHVQWRAMATSTGSRIALTNVAIQNDGNGTVTYFLTVQNQGAAGVTYTIDFAVLR